MLSQSVGLSAESVSVLDWLSLDKGTGLELYASLEEVGDPMPKLLPPLQPRVITETKEVIVLVKPSGLRTEDALRFGVGKKRFAEIMFNVALGALPELRFDTANPSFSRTRLQA